MRVSSIDTFAYAFTLIKNDIKSKGAQPVKDLKIVTHGSAGELSLGAEPFRYANVFRLNGCGEIFAAGARIELLGCEVASEPVGERMVIALAAVFLAQNGGTLIAHTEPVRWLPFTGFTFSLGRDVKIEVTKGGSAMAWGLKHLIPNHVRDRFAKLSSKYAAVKDKLSAGMILLLDRKLGRVRDALGDATRTPNTDELVLSCELLSDVEAHLSKYD